MLRRIILTGFLFFLFIITSRGDFEIMWYINLDEIDTNAFFEKIEKYPPDTVIFTIYSCDDYYALNDTRIDARDIINKVKGMGITTHLSYSLFSHPRYVIDHPEAKAERKPVDGFYIPPGQNTSVNPLYEPLHEFMRGVIKDSLDGLETGVLAFDHIRYFTFDEGFSESAKRYVWENYHLNLSEFTPTPMFILDMEGWTEQDRVYYDARADMIHRATLEVIDEFSEDYELWGTTMGYTQPARSNGQYVELQGKIFDRMLLMSYDENTTETKRNLAETIKRTGNPVYLGLHPEKSSESIINNTMMAAENNAEGVYFLGFDFPDDVFEAVSKIKKEVVINKLVKGD